VSARRDREDVGGSRRKDKDEREKQRERERERERRSTANGKNIDRAERWTRGRRRSISGREREYSVGDEAPAADLRPAASASSTSFHLVYFSFLALSFS
jgi:Ni/Co efflux regulator RcnB